MVEFFSADIEFRVWNIKKINYKKTNKQSEFLQQETLGFCSVWKDFSYRGGSYLNPKIYNDPVILNRSILPYDTEA